jgi:hypothetical protein
MTAGATLLESHGWGRGFSFTPHKMILDFLLWAGMRYPLSVGLLFIEKSRFKVISMVHRDGKSGLEHLAITVMWWDWLGAAILWRNGRVRSRFLAYTNSKML